MAVGADIDSLKPDDVVIKTKTTSSDPPKADPPVAKTDPPKPEAGKTDPPKPAAGKTDPPKADPPKPEAGKTDPPKPEAGKTDPPKPEAGKTDPPKPEAGKTDPPKPDDETAFDWEAFSEDVGVEISSDEELVDAMKELATYRALSPGIKKAIEIEQAKGDVGAYFKSLSFDPIKLSERDALWERHVAENPKLASANQKFARLDFDRTMAKKYELLEEYEKLPASEQEEFLAEHKAELEYLTEKRKFDAEDARAFLQERQSKATFFPAGGKEQPSEAKLKELFKTHMANATKARDEFDVVSIPMGKDFEFNVGITDSNRKVVNEWLKEPSKFLNELGFSNDKIDYPTMVGWMTLLADIKHGNFGERLRQAIIDNADIKTLEKTLDAPDAGKKDPPPPDAGGDEWDQVGKAFEEKNKKKAERR